MPTATEIIKYEEGRMTLPEKRKFFQKMVNDGSVWSMQGSYGREAQAMINAGEIDYPKKKTYDAYGNAIPTQSDIKKKFGEYTPAAKRRKMRRL